jgi:sarcosine oxidase subunit gamma
MREVHQMPLRPHGNREKPLIAGQALKAIVNLRGNAQDPRFLTGVEDAVKLPLPTAARSTVANDRLRIVWAGPDEWFVIGTAGEQGKMLADLRIALAGLHHAVTDVSSGYFQVTLEGPHARDLLSQGCPVDLHVRAFQPGRTAGTHFFKVGIYLWRCDGASTFQMLVRRSFIDHFWKLVEHCSLDFGVAAAQST